MINWDFKVLYPYLTLQVERENETNSKLRHNKSPPRMRREQIIGRSENKSEVEMLIQNKFRDMISFTSKLFACVAFLP